MGANRQSPDFKETRSCRITSA